MSNIVVIAEARSGQLKKTSLEAVSAGVELKNQTGGAVVAVPVGAPPPPDCAQNVSGLLAQTGTDITFKVKSIEGASQLPPIGTRVRLYVFVKPVAPFELVGHVARHVENGFALQYELFDADVQRLVDDVSALVAAA